MENSYKEKMAETKKEHRRRVNSASTDRGIIVVNTGDGKGKSSAAFGTAFRAVGHGYNVAIVQFIKGKWRTGEMEIFKKFENITHIISGEGFTWDTQDKEVDIQAAKRGWEFAKSVITQKADKEYKLLVLDEFNLVLKYGFVELEEVLNILKDKPDSLNIIITGRYAPDEIIEIADTVTVMEPRKHAFDSGIKAQKGIEF